MNLFILVLLASSSPVQACTGIGGYSLSTLGPIPIDAAVVVTGFSVASLTVYDEAGSEVLGEVWTDCYSGQLVVDHYCRYAFQPALDWRAGATYMVRTVSGTYAYADNYPESTNPITVVDDGHRVTPVAGKPSIYVSLLVSNDTGGIGSTCDYPDQVSYELWVTPAAADPDALSYVRVERRDGHTHITKINADGAPFDWTINAPGAANSADDCFRVTQVDGAGNESEPSDWTCVAEVKAEAGNCGCAATTSPGWAAIVGGAAALAYRLAFARRCQSGDFILR